MTCCARIHASYGSSATSQKLPTCGRPLSTGADLNEMYRVRRPMYQAVSDYAADNNGTVDETVESIIKATGARANP